MQLSCHFQNIFKISISRFFLKISHDINNEVCNVNCLQFASKIKITWLFAFLRTYLLHELAYFLLLVCIWCIQRVPSLMANWPWKTTSPLLGLRPQTPASWLVQCGIGGSLRVVFFSQGLDMSWWPRQSLSVSGGHAFNHCRSRQEANMSTGAYVAGMRLGTWAELSK